MHTQALHVNLSGFVKSNLKLICASLNLYINIIMEIESQSYTELRNLNIQQESFEEYLEKITRIRIRYEYQTKNPSGIDFFFSIFVSNMMIK